LLAINFSIFIGCTINNPNVGNIYLIKNGKDSITLYSIMICLAKT